MDKSHVGLGRVGNLPSQCGRAWEEPSSHVSMTAGLEQLAASWMKYGLQAQREGWCSSAAQGEGGNHHDFGKS